MKIYTDYLWFNTKNEKEIVNITDQVEEIVRDEEPGIKADLLEWAEKLAPFRPVAADILRGV